MAQVQDGWDFLSPREAPRDFFPEVLPPCTSAAHPATASTVRLHQVPRAACSDAGLARRGVSVAVGERPMKLLQMGGCLPRGSLPSAFAASQSGRLAASLAQLHHALVSGQASLQQFARQRLCRGAGNSAEPEEAQEAGAEATGSTLRCAAAFLGLRRPSAGEICAGAGGLLAVLAPLAAPGAALSMAPGAVSAAFCPIPLDLPVLKHFGGCAPLPELSLKELERGILVATFVQGSLGLLRICLGDVFSGSYTLLLATLGFNARHPGPASNWLKTYVLITFINGTMGSIDLVQGALLQNFPAVMVSLPLSVNLMHAVQLLVPGVSFIGAYCGLAQQPLLVQQPPMAQVEDGAAAPAGGAAAAAAAPRPGAAAPKRQGEERAEGAGEAA